MSGQHLPDGLRKVAYCAVQQIPSPVWVRFQWWRRFRRPLDLEHPRTYNERLQWLKVYGEQRPDVFGDVELARRCADKVSVREYVASMIGRGYLVKRLGTYDSLDDVPFSDLPEQFVIRASHDSGSTLIVTNKEKFLRDPRGLRRLRFRLGMNYGLLSKEWVYTHVKPRVVVDELLSADHRSELWDYKVFVFNGEPRLVQVDVDRFGNHRRSFYTPEWRKTDLAILYPVYEGDVPRPSMLEDMLAKSSLLAKAFRHARVDWYVLGERLLFGEITFFHESGLAPFNSREWELRMGSWMAW